MARYYVEKDGEWNIFSTITGDFLFDEFVCLDALKGRLLYERYKELTRDIDSLSTDRPKVNVMSYEEAVARMADTSLVDGALEQTDELYEIARESYHKANADYIAEQIEIAKGRIADKPRPACDSYRHHGEPSVSCDRCDKITHSRYEPRTEISRASLRKDCNGCKFVGSYDTEFPCANCVRKNKDYYTAEQTDCQWE